MEIEPLGDRALTIRLADAASAAAVAEAIRSANLPGVVDVVAAFDRVAVFLWHGLPAHDDSTGANRPLRGGEIITGRVARATLEDAIRATIASTANGRSFEARAIQIPVRYDGSDLDGLAASLNLSHDDLIARHREATYTVLAVGFTPGFAYLGGLPHELHAPRRATPRSRVPPGSLAIGGPYTGIYPSATPGGWHLIGSTDVAMFDLSRNEPSLLRVGDRVRFRSLSPVVGGEGRGEGVVARSSVATMERAEHVGDSRLDRSQPPAGESPPPHPLPRLRGNGDLVVLAPGTHTTIQDLGRPGHRAAGVPSGGASDPIAHAVANALVGNDSDAAMLECALVGPRLRFGRDAIVAVCGARVAGVPYARPFRVARGDVLNLQRFERGAYAYLAIAGGIDAPPVLGSRATDARLGIGRPLVAGDALATGRPTRRVILRDGWRAAIGPGDDAPIRVLRGEDFDASLLATTFAVSSRSDRMGARLAAASPRRARCDAARHSTPVAPGTIQQPPDGEPIVLGVDAQTIGGYAIVGHVIAADQPRLAQRRPGAAVRFVEVTMTEADAAMRRRDRGLAMLKTSVAWATSP